MRRASFWSLLILGALSTTAHAQAAPPATPTKKVSIELTTLSLMRQKGIITEAEYESAMRDLADSVGDQAGSSMTLMLGKWSTTMYGFVELDNIYDTTESFNDIAGNAQVAHNGSYGANHDRYTMGVRNSRIGFRLRAPEWHRIRASAQLEMDFLGNQQPLGYDQAYKISEGAYFTNPTFRIRHFMLRVETPWFDVLAGQYWQLFGWQSFYHPNTVDIQGVPGQIYSRTPQIRLSKTIKTKPVTLEIAVAMMRAPQRDSGTPEGQGGLRLAVNQWSGQTTAGSTGTGVQPLSVALTGDVRHFSAAEFSAAPKNSVDKTGWGVAADGFFPILPAKWINKTGALSVNAEYAWGYGTADLYTSLSGGMANPTLPPAMAGGMPVTFSPNVDPSLVVYQTDGTLHLIQWESYLIGLQYYLPGLNGRLWVSGNYSHTDSNNTKFHGAAAKVRSSEDWGDVNLFGDITPAVRLGLEYAYFGDNYVDNTTAVNHRVQLSAFYLF